VHCGLPFVAGFSDNFVTVADFDRALHGGFCTMQKDQNHPVSSGESDQFTARFRLPKLTGVADDLVQLLQDLGLLIDEQSGITDDVYEEDMCDLEMKI